VKKRSVLSVVYEEWDNFLEKVGHGMIERLFFCGKKAKKLPVGVIGVIVLLLLLVLAPNIYLLHYYRWEDVIPMLAMALAVLFLPSLFLPVRYWLLFEGLLLLALPFELTSWLSVDTPLNYGVYLSTRETSSAEAWEQLREYVLPIILLLLYWLCYFVLLFRFVPRRIWIAKKVRYGLLGGVFILVFLVPIFTMPSYDGQLQNWKFFFEDRYHPAIKRAFNNVFPFDILRYTISYEKSVERMRAIYAKRKEMKIDVSYAFEDTMPTLGVFVIGETSRACNWQLAGYDRETNPRLSQRSNLYFFDNVYAGCNLTRFSVPMLISNATPHEPELWTSTPVAPELLQAAAYEVGWVTCQSVTNPWMQVALAPCKFQRFLLQYDDYYDGEQIPYLHEFLEHGGLRQFLFMHTYGGHFYYGQRYPAEFHKYSPGLEAVKVDYWSQGSAFRPELLNSFDNTILYTDYVLDSVISVLEASNKPAFLLYAADHGENIFDTEAKMFLHASSTPTHYEAHVPMLVWLSDAYRALHPQADSILRSHLHFPLQSTVLFNTLLDLSGVKYANAPEGNSLLDTALRPNLSREILNSDCDPFPEPSFECGKK